MIESCFNMTPIHTLSELLERVGVNNGGAILISTEELHQWSHEAVRAMKKQRLIVKARPATSATCPGCERNCVMPVHTLPATVGHPSSFIVCDKRSDINRVTVSPKRLIQWQCSGDLVSAFAASSLDLRRPARQTDSAGRWEIGMVLGDKGSHMLCLTASGTVDLVAGNNMVSLAEFVEFHDGVYLLDAAQIRRLVDAALTADNRYTPSNVRLEARKLDTQAMYETWRKEYRALRKKRPDMSDVWCSRQIAKMDIAHGRDSETIRKQMKK